MDSSTLLVGRMAMICGDHNRDEKENGDYDEGHDHHEGDCYYCSDDVGDVGDVADAVADVVGRKPTFLFLADLYSAVESSQKLPSLKDGSSWGQGHLGFSQPVTTIR